MFSASDERARSGAVLYTLIATYRLHGRGKTMRFDDGFYPEMLKVHRREGGSRLSLLAIKALVRPIVFAWLPLRVRLKLRRFLN